MIRKTVLSKARFLVLLLLVILITMSSHPLIVRMSNNAGMDSGTILSRYIILAFVVLFLMCFNLKSILTSKIIRISLACYLLVFVSFLATYSAFGKNTMVSDIRSIGICLCAIMIGWQLNLDEKDINRILLVFASMTLFVGLMQVLTNVGGFQILDQYQADNKNALGVMLSSCGTIFLIMGLNRKEKGWLKSFFLLCFLFTIAIMLTIRARTASLGLAIIVLYVLFERFKGRYFLFYLCVGIILVVIAYQFMPSIVKEYVYDSFFQYRENDITSGRLERNVRALSFISEHFYLGNLDQSYRMATIHNYLLNRFFEFGFVFVLPILSVYLFLLVNTIIGTFQSNVRIIHNIGYYLLLIPFIISMAEYSFPYGPGTATVFNFLLFGQSLRFSSKH